MKAEYNLNYLHCPLPPGVKGQRVAGSGEGPGDDMGGAREAGPAHHTSHQRPIHCTGVHLKLEEGINHTTVIITGAGCGTSLLWTLLG